VECGSFVNSMQHPLLLTLESPPQHGGVARYLEGEVKNFEGEVVVSVVSANWKRLFGRARQEFKKSQCDYLWISHVLPMGYIALVWKWIYKTRYRVYLHGLDLVLPLKSSWKKFWVKMILTNADEIVVNSNATKKLLDYYKIDSGRDAKPCVSVVYPRLEKIDINKYKPIAEKLRQQYQINNKPILLTISRLVKRKGIDLVIKSLPDVWCDIPDLVYVVAGEGEDRDRLVETLHCNVSNEKQDQIIFTGPIPDEEKYGWLSACNCFILTPVDDPNDFEGYGIVYKEAQMFGKPVIGSRVGGVPEAIGENGTLVEAGNFNQIKEAIKSIIKSK